VNVVIQTLDEGSIASSLKNVVQNLKPDDRDLVLDFSSVRRIDSGALSALQAIAHQADEIKVKVVLRGVNVDLYKTLTLMRLTRQFSFEN
jgi:anti-anti-sigma regulatory factor